MKIVLLAVFLLCLVDGNVARQNQRFIVRVARFTYPDVNGAVDRCSGTAISNRHVLTTATCVTPLFDRQQILVRYAMDDLFCKFSWNLSEFTKFYLPTFHSQPYRTTSFNSSQLSNQSESSSKRCVDLCEFSASKIFQNSQCFASSGARDADGTFPSHANYKPSD
jgi:hypothetical protein